MPWLATGLETRELREGEVVVGSGPEAGWRVATAELMPRHFVVALRAGRATVRPFSTDAVVVVNDEQLSAEAHPLRDGDVIASGSERFTYGDGAPRTATVAGQDTAAHLVDLQTKSAYRLTGRSTGIGRDASNVVVVRDPTASRFHAEIRREAGGFALHPRGSAGTQLNGVPVDAPCLLTEGDVIEVAFRMLRFTAVPLTADETLAGSTPAPSDELSRRPTIPRDRTPGSNRAINLPERRLSWPLLATIVAVLAVLAAWLLRRQ